jgi:hypothetical protein
MKNHDSPTTPSDMKNGGLPSADRPSSSRKPFIPPRIDRESGLVDGTESAYTFS